MIPLPMPNAILYCRVSSERQKREGHGLESQELRCRQYAASKGYEVVSVFTDDVTGGNEERPGMDALKRYLDEQPDGQKTVVVMDDIKRWARDVEIHFALRAAITGRNGVLESPNFVFDDSPEGKFYETLMAATAELERNQNKRQVKSRMKARLEAGYWTFYPPPGYGYAKIDGQKVIVPKEPEAGIIREALEGFASGRFPTQVDVRRFLQGRGFKHRRERGKNVTYLEQVKRLLTREVYAGFIYYPHWNVTRRQGHHEPLIGPETFDRIQEKLRERAKSPPRKDNHNDFPLRGFVLCAECKKPFTASWSRGKKMEFPYYRCTTAGCAFQNKSVRADRMHVEFEALLAKLKPRTNILDAVRRELLARWDQRVFDIDAIRKERQKKLDGIQKQIEDYLDAVGRCHSPTMLKKIEEEVEALEAKKLRLGGRIEKRKDYDFERALELVCDFLKDPSLMWRTGDLGQKRLVLRLVFTEALVYDRETGFGTPSFSLPVNVSCVLELDEMEVVDMVRKSWNTLEAVVREWAESLKSMQNAA